MLLQGFQSPITKYYFSNVGITINQIKYLNRCKKIYWLANQSLRRSILPIAFGIVLLISRFFFASLLNNYLT